MSVYFYLCIEVVSLEIYFEFKILLWNYIYISQVSDM